VRHRSEIGADGTKHRKVTLKDGTVLHLKEPALFEPPAPVDVPPPRRMSDKQLLRAWADAVRRARQKRDGR
jgi:hypothetical protein